MKTKTNVRGKEGVALIIVLSFMAAISTLLAMVSFSSSQRAYTAKRLTNDIKAKAMAEAGCEYGYAILSTDWESRYDPSAFSNQTASLIPTSSSPEYQVSYANGQSAAAYEINVTPVGTRSALVTTTGTCGSVTAVSVISVQDIGGSSDDGDVVSGEAFEYAILCGGAFDFRGCGTIISPSGNAKFHANGALDNRGSTHALIDMSSSTKITSGKVTFGGDITAPSFGLHTKATVLGTKTQTNVPTVEIPDIDLTPYYNWANAHSEAYSGSYTRSSSYTPSGGILWVDGDVTISGGPGTTISGSIVATGNIQISGQVDVKPTDYAFALASRDGDITVTSSGKITGLVYAKTGGLQHTANGEIAGQIIVNGDIKKAGNSDILTSFAVHVPSPPGGSTTTDYIGISAWQR